VKDLSVSLNLPQELAFVDQQVPVQVTLTQRGSLAQRTSLSLVSDGEIVEQRDVELTPDGTTDVVFEVTRKKPGLYRFEFRAEPVGDEITEVILATDPTVEGETTALYIARILENLEIEVSRPASGIPVGGEIAAADQLTLAKALQSRRKV
jgi:hypothetical protein